MERFSPFRSAIFQRSSGTMPIAPEHRWLYPIDWRELSHMVRFERAKGRCERCRRPHGHEVIHLIDGSWWDEELNAWRCDQGKRRRDLRHIDEMRSISPGLEGIGAPEPWKKTRVALASAHLNHDPTDNRLSNLAALCQRCHMLNDAGEHRRRRWLNAYRIRAIRDLFE